MPISHFLYISLNFLWKSVLSNKRKKTSKTSFVDSNLEFWEPKIILKQYLNSI